MSLVKEFIESEEEEASYVAMRMGHPEEARPGAAERWNDLRATSVSDLGALEEAEAGIIRRIHALRRQVSSSLGQVSGSLGQVSTLVATQL